MGRNYQKIQRGYSRSREKEWTQAIVDEDYYEEVGGSGDPGIPELMAAALEREPAAPVAEQPTLQLVEESTAPLESPYDAMAAAAAQVNAGGTARKLWRRLTRLMGTSG